MMLVLTFTLWIWFSCCYNCWSRFIMVNFTGEQFTDSWGICMTSSDSNGESEHTDECKILFEVKFLHLTLLWKTTCSCQFTSHWMWQEIPMLDLCRVCRGSSCYVTLLLTNLSLIFNGRQRMFMMFLLIAPHFLIDLSIHHDILQLKTWCIKLQCFPTAQSHLIQGKCG
jgi:hypothetical protein